MIFPPFHDKGQQKITPEKSGVRKIPRFHPACSLFQLPLVGAITGAPVPPYYVQEGSSKAVLHYTDAGARTNRSLSVQPKNSTILSHSHFHTPNIPLFLSIVKWFLFYGIMLTIL